MMVTAREAYSIWKRDFRRGRLLGDYSDFNATFRDMAYRSGLIPLPPGWKLPLWSMLGGPLGGGGMGYVLGRGAGAAAAAQWWLSGGVGAANCVAAYQPKGAVSLAASYTNLANPGTYTAAPGVAPTWAAATGWTFGGSAYLTTGIVPLANTWSYLVKFSDTATSGELALIGARVESPSRQIVWMEPYPATPTVRQYRHGGQVQLNVATAVASGVMGMAGATAYLDGSSCGTITVGTVANIVALYIGAANNNGTAQALYNGKIQAVGIYNTTLSAAQVAAISAAMAAL